MSLSNGNATLPLARSRQTPPALFIEEVKAVAAKSQANHICKWPFRIGDDRHRLFHGSVHSRSHDEVVPHRLDEFDVRHGVAFVSLDDRNVARANANHDARTVGWSGLRVERNGKTRSVDGRCSVTLCE